MQGNPLQQYFRQPKIWVKLPSGGIYNQPNVVQGDVNKLPIFGMTGMDEILVKTPDALLSGESTAKLIESCVPSIKDAWDVASIDVNLLLIAMRIATYGNMMSISHKCTKCGTEHEYDVDLGKFVEYFQSCTYENSVKIDDITVKFKPLTYRQINELAIKDFRIRKQAAALLVPENEQGPEQVKPLYKQLLEIQNEIFINSIESVQVPTANVTDPEFIKEWVNNCDKDIYQFVKQQSEKNMDRWSIQPIDVTCDSCNHSDKVNVDLDYTSFFANA
jgi:hypothetical protein